MANPVIRDVTIKYANNRGFKLPGEAAEIFIDAVDADSVTVSVVITVKDSEGNTSAPQMVEIVQSDPLTYQASSENAVVTQDPAMPNHFYVV